MTAISYLLIGPIVAVLALTAAVFSLRDLLRRPACVAAGEPACQTRRRRPF